MKRSEEEEDENDAVEPEEIRALELDNRGGRDTWLGLLTGVVLYAICHILVRGKRVFLKNGAFTFVKQMCDCVFKKDFLAS